MATVSLNKENLQESMENIRQRVSEKADEARSGMDNLNQQAVQLVKEYPLMSVAGAVVAGYFLGRIFSRWR